MLTRKRRSAALKKSTSDTKQAKITEEKKVEEDRDTGPTSDIQEIKEQNILLDTIDDKEELEKSLFGGENEDDVSHSPKKMETASSSHERDKTNIVVGKGEEEKESKAMDLGPYIFEDRKGDHSTDTSQKLSQDSDEEDSESETDDEEEELETFLFGKEKDAVSHSPKNVETASSSHERNKTDIVLGKGEEEKESKTMDLGPYIFEDRKGDHPTKTPRKLSQDSDEEDSENETDDEEEELETFLFGRENEDAVSHSPKKVATASASREKKKINIVVGKGEEEKESKAKDLGTYIFEDRKGDDPAETSKKLSQASDEEDSENEGEEKDLESFLFGNLSKKISEDDDDEASNEDKEEKNEPLLSFEICTKPSVDFQVNDDGKNDVIAPLQLGGSKKPAWSDPDDQEVSVDIQNKRPLRKLRVDEDEKEVSGAVFQERLRTNFEKVLPAPAWADIKRAESENSDDEDHEEEKIFKTRKKLLSKPDNLLKGIIGIKRLKDLNKTQPSNSTITCLKFHPNAKIALTSSYSKNLSVYQVDGRDNQKLQSIYLDNFPIYSAEFTPQGDKIICSSRRKFYYVYDMIGGSVTKIPGIKGRNEKSLEKFTLSPDGDVIAFLGESGYINLVSTKTSQWIASLKMNGKVHTAAFSPDSSKLYTAGRDGEVYIWDVKSRRCLHRFIDEGSLRSTTIAIPQNGQYIALGSSSGVVNVYDEKCFVEKSPAPLKAIMNLTTSISGTVFNPSSEIMACFSSQARNALKLVHFPSLTTFSNWPIEKQTLGNVSCVDFSPKSGYLGIGNESGKALLFRLSHFPDS